MLFKMLIVNIFRYFECFWYWFRDRVHFASLQFSFRCLQTDMILRVERKMRGQTYRRWAYITITEKLMFYEHRPFETFRVTASWRWNALSVRPEQHRTMHVWSVIAWLAGRFQVWYESIPYSVLQVQDVTDFCSTNDRLRLSPEINL